MTSIALQNQSNRNYHFSFLDRKNSTGLPRLTYQLVALCVKWIVDELETRFLHKEPPEMPSIKNYLQFSTKQNEWKIISNISKTDFSNHMCLKIIARVLRVTALAVTGVARALDPAIRFPYSGIVSISSLIGFLAFLRTARFKHAKTVRLKVQLGNI